MPFTNPDFPGQIFRTIEEWKEAQQKRRDVEAALETRRNLPQKAHVVATLIPLPAPEVGRKLASLELQVRHLQERLRGETRKKKNPEGLMPGTTLFGESRGKSFSLEVLEEGYLCSDGNIYPSLSGAALGVSGNRRSGWKFWKDHKGVPIGELSGRFTTHAHVGQQPPGKMSGV